MKKAMRAIGLYGLLAGLAYGGEPPLVGSDNFNDGVRNKTLWKVADWNYGALVETNKRLYFDGLGSTYARVVSWFWKIPYTLAYGDKLDVSVLVNLPEISQADPKTEVALGMGLAEEYLSTGRKFLVQFSDMSSGRKVVVSAFGDGVPGGVAFFSLPHPGTRFYLIMRYNTVTGKVTIWQQATDNSWTDKVGVVNLNSWWSYSLGTTLMVMPFVRASSVAAVISPADGVYLDNFAVTKILP